MYSGGAADAAWAPLGGTSLADRSERVGDPTAPPVPGGQVTGASEGGVAAPARPPPSPTRGPQCPRPLGAAELRVDHSELEEMTTIEFAAVGAQPGASSCARRCVPSTRSPGSSRRRSTAWSSSTTARAPGCIRIGAPPPRPTSRRCSHRCSGRADALARLVRRSFANGWSTLGSQLESWKAGRVWDARAEGRRITAMILGVVATIAGAIAALVGGAMAGLREGGPLWLVLAVAGGLLAGAGLRRGRRLGAARAHGRGSALWLRVESFRRFLAESEGYHADEAARRGILREYTAWAVAVGEIGRWTQAVSASTIAPQVAGVHYAYFAPYLLASTLSTSTAPSSSGSGGGFGGGFGGGSVGDAPAAEAAGAGSAGRAPGRSSPGRRDPSTGAGAGRGRARSVRGDRLEYVEAGGPAGGAHGGQHAGQGADDGRPATSPARRRR